MGTVLLLWNDGAGRPLHGKSVAAARTRSAHLWIFRIQTAVESVVGPLSTQALASQIFGLYSGFVYFTPLLGGMIADRWIGQRNAVVIGALSMSAGHIAMGFDQSFLLALLLLSSARVF
jgi:dipeptide/tripeptide permease